MILKRKNQNQLRGLSHQQKVKKLQKITRVPLANLKTNIAESDLEQDDVEIPFSMMIKENINEYIEKSTKNKRQSSKKKQFNQEKVNRTIKAMANQLYSLSIDLENQIYQKQKTTTQQANVSGFYIQDFSIDNSTALSDFYKYENNQNTKEKMNDFYSCTPKTNKKQQQDNNLQEFSPTFNTLNEISPKLNNLLNMSYIPSQKYQRKQNILRQSNPVHRFKQVIKAPSTLNQNNRLQQQSIISKRFSRTKRNSEESNFQTVQRKPKFNRSNQKNKINQNIFNILNKQNVQNIYIEKKGLLTQRLSHDNVSNNKFFQEKLNKRKSIGLNFISLKNKTFLNNEQNQQATLKQKDQIEIKKSKEAKCFISAYQKISENRLFKQLGKQNLDMKLKDDNFIMLAKQVFQQYQKSIEHFKSFYS